MKNYKNLALNLNSDCFIKNFFLIQNVDHHSKNDKRNWVSAFLSSEMHYLSIGQGLTLSLMRKYQVSFKYFGQCSIEVNATSTSINEKQYSVITLSRNVTLVMMNTCAKVAEKS